MNQAHAFEINSPTEKEKAVAKKSASLLDNLRIKKGMHAYLSVDNQQLQLPSVAVELLSEILHKLAEGSALTLTPKHVLLTTQEAADFLNVSRPFLVKLLESGEIPFEKVDNRRRVLANDLQRYKLIQIKKRRAVLQKLTAQAQKLGIDY